MVAPPGEDQGSKREQSSLDPNAQHSPGSVLAAVLESAARLQELVPDAVVVGGTAAAFYAGHRDSFDHDHVLADLRARFESVLEALESEGPWVTNRVTPGKIMGTLGDIEAGVRQLIRDRPLEVAEVHLPSGRCLRVPTAEEALRIKGFLVVRRNQTRDFLDAAALSKARGVGESGRTLSGIDAYYTDGSRTRAVASQLARQLADPRPADPSVTRQLSAYRNLAAEWADWSHVREICRSVAAAMLEEEAAS